MAIEPVFLDLARKIDALREALQGLALTAIEDRPAYGQVLLVERLGDHVDDLRGLAEDTRQAVQQAQDALAHPADFGLVRFALGAASELFIRVKYRFFEEAISHATL